jgi:hypothetical protein
LIIGSRKGCGVRLVPIEKGVRENKMRHVGDI